MVSTLKYLPFIILFISCSHNNNDSLNGKNYIAYYKSDTAYLKLEKKDDRFFGKLTIKGRGESIQEGDIEGYLHEDTLVGSYYYLPYKSKDKKRKNFVVLEKNDSLIMANGTEQVYMGIPHFMPGTTNYDNPKFVFTKLN